MWKQLFAIALLSLVAILTVACDPGRDRVDVTVRYLELLNNGDAEGARELVCDERAEELTAAIMSVPESELETITFQNVSCLPRDEDVLCRYTIEQEQADNTPIESRHNVIFSFQDDVICDFEEEVAQ